MALQYNIVVAVLFTIGTAIPWVGLLAMLAVNGRATKALRAGGVRVGLMGANLQDLELLEARTANADVGVS
jgi:hypothetical protein